MDKKNINTLKIAGKEYPCRVTMGAMVRFKNAAGKDVSELKQTDISELVLFIFCCVQSACHADNVSFDMDFETFADSLEPDNVNSFYEDMAASQKKTKNPAQSK
nr:MAG TPA: tail assembly chaperone protein [Caudoviricetes sp.]DAR04799.1 MAG TPA: tail assembly chaperone protein [Caudoviricetes sp.]